MVALEVDRHALEAFCLRWKVQELALFGSVLREDFQAGSDVDVLISFADDARWGLFDLAAMQEELEKLFGRPVDLVERKGIEASHNWIRRGAILHAARPIYRAS